MILKTLVLLLSLVFLKVVCAEECRASNACECEYDSGLGYSLKDLLQPSDSRLDGYGQNGTQIFFNPCKDSKDLPNFKNNTKNDCANGYTLCLYDPLANQSFVLGTVNNTKLKEEKGQIIMTFGSSANISTILLQCVTNSKESILYTPPGTKINNINLTLFSSSACLKQIREIKKNGFFSTFFLIAFIVLLAYLLIGMGYNYFFVGARGFELLPNYDFWTRVWRSVKLGFFYVKNGCRIVPTEDSYDAI